ncbi:MAG TPA: MoxR family ATPase [Anaerolineae bacterium]|nr:MoxR family ATPase [Anaerolineae bacterium]
MTDVPSFSKRLIENIEQTIVGKQPSIEMAVIGLLCQGHLLIEDVPGVGKTVMARSLACSLGGSFSRIQFTPDMLPSDIIGVSIYNQVNQTFEFKSGPVMANIVLTDEINRATPKTQSALLEAMEERQVTVDGVTHPLPNPFMVLATQNPIEYEGTFPLPEAQLDRFLLRIQLGYPDPNDEVIMMKRQQFRHPLEDLEQVVSVEELKKTQEAVKEVYVSPAVERYIVDLVSETRHHAEVSLGASPRGSLCLYRTGQARAAMLGRDFVLPDDIKANAVPALSHRLILNPGARLRNLNSTDVVQQILKEVPVRGGEQEDPQKTKSN